MPRTKGNQSAVTIMETTKTRNVIIVIGEGTFRPNVGRREEERKGKGRKGGRDRRGDIRRIKQKKLTRVSTIAHTWPTGMINPAKSPSSTGYLTQELPHTSAPHEMPSPIIIARLGLQSKESAQEKPLSKDGGP